MVWSLKLCEQNNDFPKRAKVWQKDISDRQILREEPRSFVDLGSCLPAPVTVAQLCPRSVSNLITIHELIKTKRQDEYKIILIYQDDVRQDSLLCGSGGGNRCRNSSRWQQATNATFFQSVVCNNRRQPQSASHCGEQLVRKTLLRQLLVRAYAHVQEAEELSQ